ncbi:hypothetical protein E6R18_25255 [Streptomyces sp. A1277]|uniref:hypothetical protein n=1 Tax=Streptomyces sp. A1277 TaxID=2563103 RepID=UPI0010A24CB9|nr:hypothetical protein [Streptomyces sp. A1277]THA29216.1 hypothetical protein E6R18_25255 [Streptomyces sp. A1277]
MTYHSDMNAIEVDEADGHPSQANSPSPCTCDDEGTLVSVDMGPEDGGVIDMCVGCYDTMQAKDGR